MPKFFKCDDHVDDTGDIDSDIPFDVVLDSSLALLAESRDSCDVERFKRDRDRLMRITTHLFPKRQKRLLENDPLDWDAPYALRPSK